MSRCLCLQPYDTVVMLLSNVSCVLPWYCSCASSGRRCFFKGIACFFRGRPCFFRGGPCFLGGRGSFRISVGGLSSYVSKMVKGLKLHGWSKAMKFVEAAGRLDAAAAKMDQCKGKRAPWRASPTFPLTTMRTSMSIWMLAKLQHINNIKGMEACRGIRICFHVQ